MRRKQITQFINTTWFPEHLKKLIAEFLSWFVLQVNATKPFIPVIERGLRESQKHRIVNIDFGIGAGIESIAPFIDSEIEISSIPISDFNTAHDGLYLFPNGFHQLRVTEAQSFLQDLVDHKRAVVIVEGNNDSLWQIVGMTIFAPLSVLLTAFFVRPFRWTRILFTYLIPILPLVIMIDGCLALLKLYNPADMNELIGRLGPNNYKWETGKKRNGRGGKIMYLIGYPKTT